VDWVDLQALKWDETAVSTRMVMVMVMVMEG
jgi:hypothetical protein